MSAQIYQSQSRTTRKRVLIAGGIVVLVAAGFGIGRLATPSPSTAGAALPPSSAPVLPPSPSLPPSPPSPSASPSASATPSPVGVDAYGRLQAERFAEQSGTEVQDTEDAGGGRNVGWINNGDWVRFNDLNFGTGTPSKFVARIAVGADAPGRIEVRIDSRDSPPVATLNTTGTGGWQNWRTDVTSVTSKVTGVHTVFLTFGNDRPDDFLNLNYVSFTH